MEKLVLRIQEKKDSGEYLFPELNDCTEIIYNKVQFAGILEGGMESGKPSLCFAVKEDNMSIVLEISYNDFNAIKSTLDGFEKRIADREK